jgi:hypothetical protein
VHAVLVNVTRHDIEKSEESVRTEVAPRVSKAPGFIAGYWMGAGEKGTSVTVFESEDNAKAAADMVRGMAPDTVTIESVEVRKVVASA